MSAEPRPYSLPSRSVGVNGSLSHCSTGPVGTTSVWPAKQITGAGRAASRPKIIDKAKAHRLDLKTELLQARNQNLLTTSVVRGERTTADQFLG